MDPSGPLFQGLPESQRFDKSEAIFVQAIHTNKGIWDYFGNCGDVDFYPNCGTFQSGCPMVDAEEIAKYPVLASKFTINVQFKEVLYCYGLLFFVTACDHIKFGLQTCSRA